MGKIARRLQLPPTQAPAANTNQLPVAVDGRKVTRQRSEPTRSLARDIFKAPGAQATVSSRLENALPAHGRRQAMQPLPNRGRGPQQAVATPTQLFELSDAHLAQELGREKAKLVTYTYLADANLGFRGEQILAEMHANKDPRFDNFKARGGFPKNIEAQHAPHPSDDPVLSLPLNAGTHRRLGETQAQIAKHHFETLSFFAQRSKNDPSKPNPRVRKLEAQLNAELTKRFECSIDTLGAVVLAQLFTRLDDMVKAINNAPKDSVKFQCAKELVTKIQQFQQKLKGMSALLTDPSFLAQYPADLQQILRDYGKSIGQMERVMSHGYAFEEGPLQTLTELAREVMRRTAPSSPAPQKPLPPIPPAGPTRNDNARARDTVLRQEGASQVVQPLVSPAKPLVITVDNTREAAAAA